MNKLLSEFHLELKAKTQWQHKKLEQLPASQKIISPGITAMEYCRYLSGLYTIHRCVEEQVFPLLSNVFRDIEFRKKSHYILEDLQSLHQDPQVPLSSDALGIKDITPSFAAGICYVTEGSTLGSSYLVKNITGSLALKDMEGYRFLTCYGQNTGSMWKQFVQDLDHYSSHLAVSEKDEITNGANFAFNKFYEELNSI